MKDKSEESKSREDHALEIERLINLEERKTDEIREEIKSFYQNCIDEDSKADGIREIYRFLDKDIDGYVGHKLSDNFVAETVGCSRGHAQKVRLKHKFNLSWDKEKIPSSLGKKVKNRDGEKCVKCGSEENLEIHHIKPVSVGGGTEKENLALICHKCHLSAHKGSYNENTSLAYDSVEDFWKWCDKDTA